MRLLLIAILALTLTGCAFMQDARDAAKATYDAHHAEFMQAGDNLRRSTEHLEAVRAEYAEALKSDDEDWKAATADALLHAASAWQLHLDTYETSKAAYTTAREELASQSTTGGWLGSSIAILAALIAGAGGLGAVGTRAYYKKHPEALE